MLTEDAFSESTPIRKPQRYTHGEGDLIREELEHRFRNVLTVVDAITRQTLRGARASPELADMLSIRIAALASANSLLAAKPVEPSSIVGVITTALAPFDDGSGQITGSGPDVRLDPGITIALSMVVHELATNAIKHGALGAECGRVSVCWDFVGPSEEAFSFCWVERNGPEVRTPKHDGFGLRMIRAALAPYVRMPPHIQHRSEGIVFAFQGIAFSSGHSGLARTAHSHGQALREKPTAGDWAASWNGLSGRGD